MTSGEAPMDRMASEPRMTWMADEPVMTTLDARMTTKAAVCTAAMPASSGDGSGRRSDRKDQNSHGRHYREESLQRQQLLQSRHLLSLPLLLRRP